MDNVPGGEIFQPSISILSFADTHSESRSAFTTLEHGAKCWRSSRMRYNQPRTVGPFSLPVTSITR
jgi:hypothetical protein